MFKQFLNMRPRGSILAPQMVSKWLLEASGALLGANWAPGASPGRSQDAPEGPRGRKKIHCYLPGGLRRNFPARFHPPGGSRGPLWPPFWKPLGLILALLLATGVETAKMSPKSNHLNLVFSFLGGHLCGMFVLWLPAWLRARQPREHGEILNIYSFCTG